MQAHDEPPVILQGCHGLDLQAQLGPAGQRRQLRRAAARGALGGAGAQKQRWQSDAALLRICLQLLQGVVVEATPVCERCVGVGRAGSHARKQQRAGGRRRWYRIGRHGVRGAKQDSAAPTARGEAEGAQQCQLVLQAYHQPQVGH